MVIGHILQQIILYCCIYASPTKEDNIAIRFAKGEIGLYKATFLGLSGIFIRKTKRIDTMGYSFEHLRYLSKGDVLYGVNLKKSIPGYNPSTLYSLDLLIVEKKEFESFYSFVTLPHVFFPDMTIIRVLDKFIITYKIEEKFINRFAEILKPLIFKDNIFIANPLNPIYMPKSFTFAQKIVEAILYNFGSKYLYDDNMKNYYIVNRNIQKLLKVESNIKNALILNSENFSQRHDLDFQHNILIMALYITFTLHRESLVFNALLYMGSFKENEASLILAKNDPGSHYKIKLHPSLTKFDFRFVREFEKVKTILGKFSNQ